MLIESARSARLPQASIVLRICARWRSAALAAFQFPAQLCRRWWFRFRRWQPVRFRHRVRTANMKMPPARKDTKPLPAFAAFAGTLVPCDIAL
jgi:hypothetical protein